ncbi:MAG: biotin/lipoate A/B protein ligase family protein [Planctomycetaceae bacterium]
MNRIVRHREGDSRSSSQGQNPQDREIALQVLLESISQATQVREQCRVIVARKPLQGAWNMAVDEVLLESVAAGGTSTMRLYRWDEATVSLGYFQRSTPEVERGGRFFGLPVVRRLSGGGAILHQHELTYSCCLPATHHLVGEPARLYDEIHRSIQMALREQGVEIQPRGEHEGSDKPFLCFARGDRRDLVLDGFKVVGSAQRRRGGAVLQHGSVLLRRTPFAPEFPGLLDLIPKEIDIPRLEEAIISRCMEVLKLSAQPGDLSASEKEEAQRLIAEKYAPETAASEAASNNPAANDLATDDATKALPKQ